jgi:rubrerythrin
MRDYGLSDHHLLRQDRHAHNFDDDCDAHLRGWRADDPCRRSWQSVSANEGIDQVGYDHQHVGEDGFGQEGEREEGHEEVAKHFEHTADQELLHAWGHLELLVGKPDTRKCLEMAIEGETYEFTTMYPEFEAGASAEGNQIALNEFRNQITESAEHAEQFKAVLAKAEKRFSALKRIEKRHADAYQQVLESL